MNGHQPARRASRRPAVTLLLPCLVILFSGYSPPAFAQSSPAAFTHPVLPGDTWTALSLRYALPVATLQAANPHPNPGRQPVIGATVQVPLAGDHAEPPQRLGLLLRPDGGGLLATAAHHGRNPWSIVLANDLRSPYLPPLYRALLLPGGDQPPRDLPVGLDSLELSMIPAVPGRALAYRALAEEPLTLAATLAHLPIDDFFEGRHLVGLVGTGAFFPPGDYELTIRPDGRPLWSQPWRMVEGVWDFQDLTLTGAAAAIDADAIARERERLMNIWTQVTPLPLWNTPFRLPIHDYLALSATYGGRRSYNGGPYRTYHEGVDFSAYAGAPVYASAAGRVALAELLYVRGGAVILDHGLGVYSGYYHLSTVIAQAGEMVQPGQLLGEVGTTGLSTGNHLHWDFLVAGAWVDATIWLEQDLACWLLTGLGRACQPAAP